MSEEFRNTTPGMHRSFRLDSFEEGEQRIVKKLSSEWYLTHSGEDIELGATSKYRYFLMKPTRNYAEMFNLEREIMCVFSPYPVFESRTLDAFDIIKDKYQDLRVEHVCRVLISADNNIEQKISDLLKTDPEQPIIIPFSYDELLGSYDSFFIRNRFCRNFYTRDLFAFLSPLTKDLYFFGRSELILNIVNRHRSREHTALFGLRKTGKTSIIYAIERLLKTYDEEYLSFDCENPSIHQRRWNELLYAIVEKYKDTRNSKYKISDRSKYTPSDAADHFLKDMLGIYQSKKRKATLLIFDEIERISPRTGAAIHWRDGEDFVFLWQTLRSFFQRYPDVFTYMIVGTNPSCIEHPSIGVHDNPIFGSIPFQYVPCFTVQKTREMVRKLGRYMGLKFEELVYAKLTEDFGGHPFLIRQVCSFISSCAKGERPYHVDRTVYDSAKKNFQLNAKNYLDMVVRVLHDWYRDEYDMLVLLAQRDAKSFKELAQDRSYINHLIGYGLISQGKDGFTFNIEALRDYLVSQHRYERTNLSVEERIAEISERRNRLEMSIRKLARNQLITFFGEAVANDKVIAALPANRRDKLLSYGIRKLLHPSESPLFWNELTTIIDREWDAFVHVFQLGKDKLTIAFNDINHYRVDAHARNISDDDFQQLRLHFKKLESDLEKWFD